MISIRVANAADAGVLTDLGRRTFFETFAADNTPEDMDAFLREEFVVERVSEGLRRPGTVFLIAEELGKAIGFARLEPADPPECVKGPSPIRLLKLYVSADVIGSGIGASLMRASIEWAVASGHRTMWLGVWERNHRARAFYERWGFRQVGSERFRLGSDDQTDLVMERILNENAKDQPPA